VTVNGIATSLNTKYNIMQLRCHVTISVLHILFYFQGELELASIAQSSLCPSVLDRNLWLVADAFIGQTPMLSLSQPHQSTEGNKKIWIQVVTTSWCWSQ